MILTRIFTVLTVIIALAMGAYLAKDIYDTIQQEAYIDKVEDAVVERLKQIRTAQEAYKAVTGDYTANWDSLLMFSRSGEFFLLDRKETLIDLGYGRDSLVVDIDTLGTVGVYDSLFAKIPEFDLAQLPFVPYNEGVRFDIFVGKVERKGLLLDVIEVKDPAPINPARKEDADFFPGKPLRFGSKTNVSTSGNWE